MEKIKNVLICGLGALGTFYAYKISQNDTLNLKVLVDSERLERYKREPRKFNNEVIDFDYILPESKEYKADLIIIATKSYALQNVIEEARNFVDEDTILLSLLNGINSENEINSIYKHNKGLYSYVLGHTFFREDNEIRHDGESKIYFGSTINNDYRIGILTTFFKDTNILYEVKNNILTSLWNKFAFNCCVNQISAVTRYDFKTMSESPKCLDMMKHICQEISQIAKCEGVAGYDDFYDNVIKSLALMCPEGKSSMLQDIESGNRNEIDIFGKTIVELGKKYGIDTPYNTVLSEIIDTVN